MATWVLTDHDHHPGFTDLLVHSSTNVEDHLYMAWELYRPRQEEIWRTVRGKRIFCGYRYVWDTPHVAEQSQPGDTLAHWFHIDGLPIGSTVWYYLNSPDGPYGRECQGPLMHAHLLTAAAWVTRAFFASRSKGMYRTADFSGPGGPHPTWIPDNDGLAHLDIRQACEDPWDPYHRRFVIAGGHVYRMDNFLIDDPATATLVLSNADAVTLTGGAPGLILWICGNENYQDHFYVLFCCEPGGTGFWCIKTIDAGLTWTVSNIYNHVFSWDAGNIQAGTRSGESPYPPGDVLYATINYLAGGAIFVGRSFDEGENWALTFTKPPGPGMWEPRLYIEPSDQSIVYVGAGLGGRELLRTLNHGWSWSLADAGNLLGIIISPLASHSIMRSYGGDPLALRVLKGLHIWKSSDFGVIWRDQGPTQYSVRHMHFRDDSPDFLYLARIFDAPPPDGIYARHVLFVTQDEGSNMFGKAGEHADLDDGGGDSIPWNCGGAASEGILTLP